MSGVNTASALKIIALSNHWYDYLTWPQTVFLKGHLSSRLPLWPYLLPMTPSFATKPCKHLCTHVSQVTDSTRPSHVSCGLRHSWLFSIEKQKIAWYQENFYLPTHTTLRECSIDLSVGWGGGARGVINKSPQVKRKWKQKKKKLNLTLSHS